MSWLGTVPGGIETHSRVLSSPVPISASSRASSTSHEPRPMSAPPDTGPGPRGSRKSTGWRWIAVAVLVLPAAYALFSLLTSINREPIAPIRGIRLGYAPAQARERLVTGAPGSFRTVTMDEDFALEWAPTGPGSALLGARLEFHLGQLVAARLQLSEDAEEASGPRLEVSDASVLTREASPEGVELTWLARSCPTHAPEVQRRLSESR